MPVPSSANAVKAAAVSIAHRILLRARAEIGATCLSECIANGLGCANPAHARCCLYAALIGKEMVEISAIKISRRTRTRTASMSLVALAIASAPLASQAQALAMPLGGNARQAPGAPGVPQAPVAVFAEGFENAGETPVFLEDYVGAPPLDETYTADSSWLDHGQCNGIILNQTGAIPPDCPAVLKDMANALGQVGGTNPPSNHVVAAYTNWVAPGADRVEFQTEQPIPIAKPNRYITFAVDAAAVNCDQANPQLKFYLTGNGADIPTFTTPINPCTDPNAKSYPEGSGLRAGTFAGNRAVLFNESRLGIKMLNGQGEWFGNDHAFDNIRILDATPQLDKAFSPATIDRRGTSTLTMTVTNTSELAAKDDFSFVDRLPAGVRVASHPNASTTCGDGTVSATARGTRIALNGGDLAAGEKSCTVTVDVTAARPGTYVNRPEAITAVGLDLPAPATLTVNRKAAAVGTATGSPGLLSGNLVQAPVEIPVNACGNSVNVVGALNPAAGNVCVNE
ncbi:chaplin [Streptomyces sp. NPDC102437]|uniref:chaplin n=1 Tax=Streptomyces sp. NPDC102437 TaxID=3366175 RepID=UPI0037F7B628